jgi:hypothetical protein
VIAQIARRKKRQAEHGGYEVAGNHVRQFGDGRFVPLRFFDQMNDLGERGVLADVRHAES